MTPTDPGGSLEAVLEAVARGTLPPEEAARRLRTLPAAELGFANVDTDRLRRRGRAETIFGERKSPLQVVEIARALLAAGQNVLATRLAPEARDGLVGAFPSLRTVRHDDARLVYIEQTPVPRRAGTVAVLAAGTTDLPVAEEAALTAEAFGSPVSRFYDVGVAGLHRLLRRLEDVRRARVIIAVAGMEGALPSVVAGLVRAPVIAVPTSVGYGASLGGVSALLTMLSSCAPGIAVVNIDNGFGAGYLADVINELGDVSPPAAPSSPAV